MNPPEGERAALGTALLVQSDQPDLLIETAGMARSAGAMTMRSPPFESVVYGMTPCPPWRLPFY